jgi:homopolymeric O-antigen transport system ATP-binding protein
MSSEAIAVRVDGVSKCYRIYERPEDRLKEYVLPRLPGFGRARRRSWSREFWAVRDVSFEVERGETLGIIGRNGSGKSTLLQLICGTADPTTGIIETHGRIGALLELGAGFNPEFTGLENLYLVASLHGLTRGQIDARVDAIAAFADIGDFLQQPVKTYSSGMYVRLAFAVAAHVDADILVIDEALAVGDAFFVQKCMRYLRSFMEKGTLIFVSHDLGAVASLCDRVLLVEAGSVKTSGEPRRVLEHYLASLCNRENTEGQARPRAMPAEAVPEHRGSRIQIFGFRQDSGGFGTGQARILSVRLQDESGIELAWAAGGTTLNLQVVCGAAARIDCPIVGFQLKDRLGQAIFGENTFLRYQFDPLPIPAGGEVEANFSFRMPDLPRGDYSFSVAIAEGTQDSHLQHHWLHEALMIRVHTTAPHFGLVGVPMTSVRLIAR